MSEIFKTISIMAIVVLLTVLTVMCEEAEASNCKTVEDLNFSQRLNLSMVYKAGEKYDLGYTLMSIALKESQAGKYLVNTQTKDYGILGISLKSASWREGIEGHFSKNILAQKLIMDTNYNISMGIKELLFWRKYWKNDWKKVVMSYNGGTKYERGREYMQSIRVYVKMFKKCAGDLI